MNVIQMGVTCAFNGNESCFQPIDGHKYSNLFKFLTIHPNCRKIFTISPSFSLYSRFEERRQIARHRQNPVSSIGIGN